MAARAFLSLCAPSWDSVVQVRSGQDAPVLAFGAYTTEAASPLVIQPCKHTGVQGLAGSCPAGSRVHGTAPTASLWQLCTSRSWGRGEAGRRPGGFNRSVCRFLKAHAWQAENFANGKARHALGFQGGGESSLRRGDRRGVLFRFRQTQS